MFRIDEDSKLLFNLDTKIYSLDSVMKCLYWLQEQWDHDVTLNDDKILVSLSHREHVESRSVLEAMAVEVSKSFLDFSLKDRVFSQTATVRELILAKAFANYEG
jgi:His-Xaa-Ser system protein HxsD